MEQTLLKQDYCLRLKVKKTALAENFIAVWCLPFQLVNINKLFIQKLVKYNNHHHDIQLKSSKRERLS